MGSLDGGEVTDLIGLYMLYLLRTKLGSKVRCLGLYRDDMLLITYGNGHDTDRLRKDICLIFRNEGLILTCESQASTKVDFLDINFDLTEESFKPYQKPNDSLLYINSMSDHPACIKRSLPNMIEHRISRLCSSEMIFKKEKTPYEAALKTAGYNNVNLMYRPEGSQPKKNSRKRNNKRSVAWFNPPFSSIVKTKVGKVFFSILEKNFPKDSPLRKIMNRNYVKLSYCCMPNVHSIISGLNRRKMDQYHETDELLKHKGNSHKTCNCPKSSSCPLDGNCLIESVVYLATVNSMGQDKLYYGLTEGPFKTRWNKHQSDFRLAHHRNDTDLSEHIWALKDKSENYTIKWSVVEQVPKFKPNRKNFCQLCASEKRFILSADPMVLINKRDEFLNKCRHANKYKLKNVKYDQHVDLLYHTANPLIENQPAINMTANHLSKPRRHKNNLKIHTTLCQPPSNSSSDAPINHIVGLNTMGTSPPVSVNNGEILTSARTRMQNKRIYNSDFIT